MTRIPRWLFVILVGYLAFANVVGCAPATTPPSKFEPNYLYAHALGKLEDMVLDQPLDDTQDLLTEWFGTLDKPVLPPLFAEDEYKDLLTLSNLEKAAGPPAKTAELGENGLYRQLCASCHGESGQGRGPVAASQNPYPREFRHGIFKYKNTPRKYKPTKEDIAKTLRRGLSGSQMPLFNKLSSEQMDALVDYVIFLSIRGEFERKLLYNATYEMDEKDRVYSVSYKGSQDSESKKKYESQIESAEEILTGIVDVWVESADSVEKFEMPDDWTKDWTTKIGIKPTDTDLLLPLMARGALKPQPLVPRNIVEGKFRGGREPMELYRRIRYGIVGAPMPAATVVKSSDEKGLQEADLWHLVNYVLSIAAPPEAAIETKALVASPLPKRP